MHHTRLVGGLISLAALLTLLLVPSALLADTSSVTAPTPGSTPAPTAAGSPSASPAPTPVATATAQPAPRTPRLTRAQRRAKRRAAAIARKQRLVLQVARRQLGVPYVYGGASRGGFDCSGLTLYVYRSLGRSLPPERRIRPGAARTSRCGISRPGTSSSTAARATTTTWASTPGTGASSTRLTRAPWSATHASATRLLPSG